MFTDESPNKPSLQHTVSRAQPVINSLSLILGPIADSNEHSDNPAMSLLHNQTISRDIMCRLRLATSGSGTDDLCRWLYDTFQSNIADLQLVVISYIPTLAGVYLSRCNSSKETFSGFEAVFLALYSHEMVIRGAEACIIRIPNNIRIPGASESGKANSKGKATAAEPDSIEAIVSPALEPCNTVRATKRGLIVSIAFDLYYNDISLMPVCSKIEFCEFCIIWAGQDELAGAERLDEEEYNVQEEEEENAEEKEEDVDKKKEHKQKNDRCNQVPLPWELFQSVLRILGHCLLGPTNSKELKEKALKAAKCLHARALRDFHSKAMLASRSLVRLGDNDMIEEPVPELQPSEITADLSELEALRASIFSR
ncbi:Hyccin protein [Rhynchospora pubera]|uniref:Hyccin protein n=1 Tax=Rhynchospora pubera TaxID=906938 RepID=A0AAV8F6U8_9POAL|nr:Hyccin protein [Rhynchospora pubera]